jgi:hypothetical protein
MVRVWFRNHGHKWKTTGGLEKVNVMRRKYATEVLAASMSDPTAIAMVLKLQSWAASGAPWTAAAEAAAAAEKAEAPAKIAAAMAHIEVGQAVQVETREQAMRKQRVDEEDDASEASREGSEAEDDDAEVQAPSSSDEGAGGGAARVMDFGFDDDDDSEEELGMMDFD